MNTQSITQKIFEFLYEGPYEIYFTQSKKFLGLILPDKLQIIISTAKIMPVDNLPPSPAVTLIHEILHDLFPDYCHNKIDILTALIWQNLSEREKLCLYEYLFE